jgi:hypothetical protein
MHTGFASDDQEARTRNATFLRALWGKTEAFAPKEIYRDVK